MAQQENNLGAPTQGLGQTVTFDYKSDANGVPQLNAEAPLRVRAGLDGLTQPQKIDQFRASQGGGEDASAIAELVGVVGKVAQPFIEQHHKDMFLQGMTRAANGEAVKEIADEQPWYSRLFGASDVVEGARAYATSAQVGTLVNGFTAALPELRKLGPAEAQAFYAKQLENQKTGDSATDAGVMSAFIRQMPTLMTQQAKHHQEFLQERAAVAQGAAFSVNVDQLQNWGQEFADGRMTADKFAELKSNLVFDSVPAAGQDLENFTKTRVAGIVASLAKNQLHGVSALQESGMLASLPPAYQDDIARARIAAEVRLDAMGKRGMLNTLTDIRIREERGEIAPAEGRAIMQAANAQHAKRTGSTKPLFTDDELINGAARAAASVFRRQQEDIKEARRAAREGGGEAARLAAEANKQAMIAGALGSGTMPPSGATASEIQEGFNWIRDRAKESPDQLGTLLPSYKAAWARGDGLIDKGMANRNKVALDGAIKSEDPGQIIGQYQQWLRYNAVDPNMAEAYVGDERLAMKMARYHRIADGDTKWNPVAFQAAFASDYTPPPASAKDREGWNKQVQDEMSYYVPEWIGSAGSPTGATATANGRQVAIRSNGIDLKEGQADLIRDKLERNIRDRQYGDPDKAVSGALAAARQRGELSVLGGYAVFNMGAKGDTVEQTLVTRGLPPDQINNTFEAVIEKGMQSRGLEGRPIVTRNVTVGGELGFIVFTAGGQFQVTGKDLEDAYRTRKGAAEAEAAAKAAQLSPNSPGYGRLPGSGAKPDQPLLANQRTR